ncbi:MAG TPA: hypothetical protein ENF75_04745 [Acidilobales archaeon]|nr:MAG: hypothetical protein DRO18_04735 [Thermoprotei archaeon]HDD26380.1 hypothetical protein [Acidilobales archaeon]
MSVHAHERGKTEEKVIKGLVRYGRTLVLIVEAIIIASVSALIALTTYYLARDMMVAYRAGSVAELQLIMNDIFLLIVYVELVRSIIVAYRRPEMYLVSIAEVGFVITVREVLASVIAKTTLDLVLASIASAVFAVVLWILYRKVLPHRRESKKEERGG